jgi:hypothetical protein
MIVLQPCWQRALQGDTLLKSFSSMYIILLAFESITHILDGLASNSTLQSVALEV